MTMTVLHLIKNILLFKQNMFCVYFLSFSFLLVCDVFRFILYGFHVLKI